MYPEDIKVYKDKGYTTKNLNLPSLIHPILKIPELYKPPSLFKVNLVSVTGVLRYYRLIKSVIKVLKI